MLELCSELYGQINDDTVNGFISQNKLTADEILELPRGKRVSYYA